MCRSVADTASAASSPPAADDVRTVTVCGISQFLAAGRKVRLTVPANMVGLDPTPKVIPSRSLVTDTVTAADGSVASATS